MPELWFQHDDYFDPDLSDNINEKEIAADMLERWVKHKNWQKCLKNIDVYSIHENLFKIGNPDGMGGKFYRFLINYFGPLDTIELYKSYLRLILPILHKNNIKLQIHTVGSKGDFVPWPMKDCNDNTLPRNNKGLELVLKTISLINSVCEELFKDSYRVKQVKLQSVLSGHWQRGLQNNIYCALEYMKQVQNVHPEIEFYLGDALLQRRDCNKNLNWRDAYQRFYHTMLYDPRGYSKLNFKGFRIEFDKKWNNYNEFENAEGWKVLADSGALRLIQSYGWEIGIEHNHPFARDGWEYEYLVLRTAKKIIELKLNFNFAVMHTDAAGGNGYAIPHLVAPEDLLPGQSPTFSNVINKVYDFYYLYYCKNLLNVENYYTKGEPLINVYPNPANKSIIVDLDLNNSDIILNIYNSFGQLINQINAVNKSQIEIKNLPNGLFFLQVLSNGKVIGIEKFIVID